MPFLVTTFLLLGLSMQLTLQTIGPNIPVKDFHNDDELMFKLHLRNGEKRLSPLSFDSSASLSESSNAAELRQYKGKNPYDVLALIVVDDRRYAHGRRGKLLEPYRSLSLRPEKLAEADALSKLRNPNPVKNQAGIRKGEAKELYLNLARLPLARHKKTQISGYRQPPKVWENIPPFPDVSVQPLSRNERVKNAKPNRGTLPSREKDAAKKGNTYIVSRDQLIALRARWSKTCDKAAAKECKTACKHALKDACSDRTCKHKLKKSFKRACNKQCKGRFISSGGGSGSGSGSGSD